VFDSWFFFVVNVGFMCVGLSSSWLEARRRLLREKRSRWDPTGAYATRRLSARPRKAKSCTEIKIDKYMLTLTYMDPIIVW